ncbi:MAG: hypothetical protein HYV07_31870 [Deltaproteobacteria bacterium]|nr:hypothetical protein [Deltaproteobacteria bacterium]
MSTRGVSEIFVALLTLGLSSPTFAFLELEAPSASFELRGTIRVSEEALQPLFEGPLATSTTQSAGSLRLIADVRFLDTLRLEAHGVQSVSGLTHSVSMLGELRETDRLELTNLQRDTTHTRIALELDRLSIAFSAAPFDLTIGRQPINFATAQMFTPNDLFSPFSAQTFYRIYKPGVDAARLDVELAELSSLTVVGVLGYDAFGDPDPIRSTGLIRALFPLSIVEVSGFIGRVRDGWIAAAGIQGELFETLGIRGEAQLLDGPNGFVFEGALGVERRFESTWFLRAEYLVHGAGAASKDGYVAAATRRTGLPYLGRHYSALGAGYELTALAMLDSVLIINWIDPSALVAVYLTYSLLDEAEAALSVSVPLGRSPNGLELESELGTYPLSVSGEVRCYF